MQPCPNCGHQNRAGIVFCENCGASLIGNMPLNTKALESDEQKAASKIDASVVTDVKIQGTTLFGENTLLRLAIEGSPEPILFKPKSETIFGRRDPATGAMPDVDLTPFAGYRMGVSRRHAAIRFGDEQNLDLWDLGSSNGTFLNGNRLNAHRPYRLHDGDEIRLGQMVLRVFFASPDKPVIPEQTAEANPPEQPAAAPSTAVLTDIPQPPVTQEEPPKVEPAAPPKPPVIETGPLKSSDENAAAEKPQDAKPADEQKRD
jgi:hypothetical protein